MGRKREIKSLERALNYWVNKYDQTAKRLREQQKQTVYWENQTQILAGWLMSEWVFVHESKVEEVDNLLAPHRGGEESG